MNQRFRQAYVYLNDRKAGVLEETERGYRFTYSDDFLDSPVPVSVTLPVRSQSYESRELFPFFQGLIPEGWYLEIILMKLKLDKSDLFGILLGTCEDTVGSVTIERIS
ncbi:MAG: HipA N-terminal domain-containing protein [bacterium]|nr:HipA N-terminal domain-containing protein [bacterium]